MSPLCVSQQHLQLLTQMLGQFHFHSHRCGGTWVIFGKMEILNPLLNCPLKDQVVCALIYFSFKRNIKNAWLKKKTTKTQASHYSGEQEHLVPCFLSLPTSMKVFLALLGKAKYLDKTCKYKMQTEATTNLNLLFHCMNFMAITGQEQITRCRFNWFLKMHFTAF